MDEYSMDLPENVDELIQIQKELKEEEEMLHSMVFKIDKQLHVLEVEKMHLMNLMCNNQESKASTAATVESHNLPADPKDKPENPDESNLNIDLNLSLSSDYKYYDEEEDSEEEEDYDDYM